MLTLSKGDKVALVAPASGQKKGQEFLIEQAIDVLHAWGLNVVISPAMFPDRYLAANDLIRANTLIDALTRVDVKAVFVTRGGYGAARLLPYLKKISIPTPRFFVGFSDITTLHLHFQHTKNLYRIHASNLATRLFLDHTEAAKKNRLSLHAVLFEKQLPELQLTPFLKSNLDEINSNPNLLKVGGCLSLLTTSLGTSHEIQTEGKILMIEDVGESPYKIDRMLTHLKNAGKFQQAKAVVIGLMANCNGENMTVDEVLQDVLSDIPCPVYRCNSFGHGEFNLPWLYY